jgi:hypothetical protein
MNSIKSLITSSLLLLGLVAAPVFGSAGTVGAQADCLNNGGIGQCLDAGAGSTDPNSAGIDAAERVSSTVQLIVNVFSWIVGVIAVIMIIIGGLRYITSGGDSGNVTSAKNTILYAIIGLVIVALAQIIVRFVIGQVTA